MEPFMRRIRLAEISALLIAVIATAGVSGAAEETLFYDNRDDIPMQYRWNLNDIFPNIEAWEGAYQRASYVFLLNC